MSFFTDNVILLAPQIEPSDQGDFKFSPQSEIARLKRYLLYFPRLALIPYFNQMLGFNLVTEEHQLLHEQGLISSIQHRRVETPKLNVQFFNADLCALFSALNQANGDTKFSVSRSIADEAESDVSNCYVCKIVDALPAPRAEVSIAEIIEVRESRAAELERFGRYINRLTASFVDEQSQPRSNLKFALEELENQMGELQIALDQTGLFEGKISISIGNFINAVAIPGLATFVAQQLHLPPLAGLAAGGLIQISFRRTPVGGFGNVFPRDFEYILESQRQGITGGQTDGPEVDYLHYAFNDANNVLGFGFPPNGTPVRLPFNRQGAFISNMAD